MDSKAITLPPHEEEVPPPSYSESLTAVSKSGSSIYRSSNFSTHSSTQSFSAQIYDQIRSITSQINTVQTQKSLVTHAKDEKILSILTSEIQHYLSTFANTGLQKGTLVLIPDKALEDKTAMPTSFSPREVDAYKVVARVSDKESDDSGQGDLWYWKDHSLAQRLAGYLRPAPDPYNAELPSRNDSNGQEFRGKLEGGSQIKAPMLAERSVDKIEMNVDAKEVLFRTENAYGTLENQRGWAVVLELNMVLTQR